jgi:transcriptional regulator with XRE-family HTH domain
MKNEPKRTGQLIREARIARDLTQMELSELLGVSYQQVQKYEKGSDNISMERLKQIARAMNLPVTAFITGAADSVAEQVAAYGKTPEDEKLLVRYYRAIKSKKAKKAVIELVKSMSVE